jgi:hypothetical protein
MKTISQIIGRAQALLNISFNLTECFEEYLSDKYKMAHKDRFGTGSRGNDEQL